MEISQKSTLAKLLATENITLEHKNVPTAYFDLKERKVVLPVFKKEMSADLYDLLIGHEVSHALNTPLDGWHDNASAKGRGYKSFLNVVEDARIERDIKKRFPGLTKSFYRGYRELYELDFFGIGDRDINTFPLIDRINLFFKVGQFANVEFTDDEQVFVDRITNAETWEDVVAIANDLYGKAKDEQDEEEENVTTGGNGDEGEEGDQEVPDMPMESSDSDTEEDPEEEEEQDGSGNPSDEESDNEDGEQQESDEESDEESESSTMDEFEDDNGEEPASITDQNFRKNEDKLVDAGSPEMFWVNFPKLDHKKFINLNPWDSIEEDLRKSITFNLYDKEYDGCYTSECRAIDFDDAVEKMNNVFNKKNRAYINMMVNQFESKRKAKSLMKARENKTGELNMDKLWATKLTEDVFLSTTVVPDGKNHGMLMAIDFSGSMWNKMAGTIEQLLVQIAFCKKVNIPFEVYSFTNNRGNDKIKHAIDNQKKGDLQLVDQDLHIMRLIHSGAGKNEYKKAFNMLLVMMSGYSSYKNRQEGEPFCDSYSFPRDLNLGGTPLDHMALLMRPIALEFRKNYGIDVLNTLFLTDGGNTGALGMGEVDDSGGYKWRKTARDVYAPNGAVVAIRENGMTTLGNPSGHMWQKRFSDQVCEAVIAHYDRTTGSRTVNYFLGENNKHRNKQIWQDVKGWSFEKDAEFADEWRKNWLGDGFLEVNGMNGFANAFILKSSDLGHDEELEIAGDAENKGALLRGFKKFQKNKTNSRKFLSKFIEKIA